MMSSNVMRYLHQSLFINHRVWSHKTSLMPPLFIEVPVPGHLSETVMHLCIMGIDVASFLDFSIGFGTVPTVWYFWCFILYVWYIRGTRQVYIQSGIHPPGNNYHMFSKIILNADIEDLYNVLETYIWFRHAIFEVSFWH